MRRWPMSDTITNVLKQEVVKQLFYYDDGILRWRENPSNVSVGDPAGSPNGKNGHLSVQYENSLYRVHNLIWILFNGDIPDGVVVDHKNNISIDNRIENLRLATLQENQFNSKKRIGTSSKYKGVHWNKQSSSWRASIRVDGRVLYIGNFKTELEAHEAWCVVAKKIHGDFFNPG